jgi:monooxygenase
VRWKNVLTTMLVFQLSRRRPRLVRELVRKGVARRLPPGFDVDTHFAPSYDPWDQRMCLVPDGDLFDAISAGRASIVTDHVEGFVEHGVQLRSGRVLDADLVVTATGLNLLALGGVSFTVDGREVDPAETMSYRGMMLSGVPNMAVAFGYTNASWTLKCDLTCAYVCRLLSYMDERGYVQCTPSNDDPSIAEEPFIDFSSGYVQRAIHLFPKQGSKRPWRLHQNYALDIVSLRYSALDDGALRFSRAGSRESTGAADQAHAALA